MSMSYCIVKYAFSVESILVLITMAIGISIASILYVLYCSCTNASILLLCGHRLRLIVVTFSQYKSSLVNLHDYPIPTEHYSMCPAITALIQYSYRRGAPTQLLPYRRRNKCVTAAHKQRLGHDNRYFEPNQIEPY